MSRKYGSIAPTYWTRGTGKKLRGNKDARILSTYLMTAPTANMIGLYYIPIAIISHETGLTVEEVEGALDTLGTPFQGDSKSFLVYDRGSDTVFVRTMARRQLGLEPGECLKPKDNNRQAIIRMMRDCENTYLLQAFWDEYAETLRLPDPWWENPLRTPFEPPPGTGIGIGIETGTGICIGTGSEAAPEQPTNTGSIVTKQSEPPPPPERVPSEPPPAAPDDPDDPPVEPGEPKPTFGLKSPEPARKGRQRLQKIPIPDDWTPNEDHRRLAKEEGRDFDRELQKFKDDAVAKRKKFADWDAAYRNWLRSDFGRDSSSPGVRRVQEEPGWQPKTSEKFNKAMQRGNEDKF